jgi:hypothetical protein
MRARVRSATPPRSSPPYSIRGLVFRRGVRRGPGNFAGDPSVPSHQAHGAPPGQGPLHRTPAYPRTNDNTATERRADAAPTRRPRTRMAVCTHAATQGFQLMMGASLLISLTGPKSPLFDMARAAGAPARPLTPIRTQAHAHTHTLPSLLRPPSPPLPPGYAAGRSLAVVRCRRRPRRALLRGILCRRRSPWRDAQPHRARPGGARHNEYLRTHVGYSEYPDGVPMGYSEYSLCTTACCRRSAARW